MPVCVIKVLRQEVDVSTDFVTKLSHKKSLYNIWAIPSHNTSYLLAWNCFKTIYVPLTSGTRQRHQITKDAIAALYSAHQLRPPGSSAAPNPGKWLVTCKARSYLYPTLSY